MMAARAGSERRRCHRTVMGSQNQLRHGRAHTRDPTEKPSRSRLITQCPTPPVRRGPPPRTATCHTFHVLWKMQMGSFGLTLSRHTPRTWHHFTPLTIPTLLLLQQSTNHQEWSSAWRHGPPLYCPCLPSFAPDYTTSFLQLLQQQMPQT